MWQAGNLPPHWAVPTRLIFQLCTHGGLPALAPSRHAPLRRQATSPHFPLQILTGRTVPPPAPPAPAQAQVPPLSCRACRALSPAKQPAAGNAVASPPHPALPVGCGIPTPCLLAIPLGRPGHGSSRAPLTSATTQRCFEADVSEEGGAWWPTVIDTLGKHQAPTAGAPAPFHDAHMRFGLCEPMDNVGTKMCHRTHLEFLEEDFGRTWVSRPCQNENQGMGGSRSSVCRCVVSGARRFHGGGQWRRARPAAAAHGSAL